MKKIRTIAALAAVAMGFGFASQAQILYKIEKPGSEKTSYILGTHHFAPLAAVDSIAELKSVLEGADKLYGEIDMSKMQDPAVMMGLQQTMLAPMDSTLDKVLTPAQLDSVKNVWNEYTGGAAPFEMMQAMKPALISTQLAAMMSMKVLPELNPMEGIDMTMQNRARQLGKPVEGLETMEFQMNMLYNKPIAEQAKDLMKEIRDVEGVQSQATKLAKAYMDHDIDALLDLMLEAEDGNEAEIERIIYSRNDNWVKKLVAEMPSESLVVVVGAGHLPGQRGVLEGLRKSGFKVTPVK